MSGVRFTVVVAGSLASFGLAAAGEPCGASRLDVVFLAESIDPPGHQSEDTGLPTLDVVERQAPTGAVGSLTLRAGIVSNLQSEQGVQGWTIGASDSGDITIASVEVGGTAAAPDPDGLVKGGFTYQTIETVPSAPDRRYFVAAAVLSMRNPVTLRSRGTAQVLTVRVATARPQDEEPQRGSVTWEPDLCRIGGISLGCGQPINSMATVGGVTVAYCEMRGVEVVFRPGPAISFRRGDANADGRVDISDAIRVFMYLFMDSTPLPCQSSSDTNDDGWLDISDAITVLNDFFQPGTGIRDPGPFTCGTDPTPDSLSCEDYRACGSS